MNYELAKQLQDAGFPQKGGEHLMNHANTKVPSLSELIEACGENFNTLKKSAETWWSANAVETFKYRRKHPHYAHCIIENARGKTPEEAVANLWLALNKK